MSNRNSLVGRVGRFVGITAFSLASISLSAWPAESQGVVDNFNRADAPVLGTASSGQPWSVHAGTVGVSSGTAAPSYGFLLASIDGGAANLNVDVNVGQTGPEFWLILRFVDGSNYWRFGRWNGQNYVLQQIVSNSLASPAIEAGPSITPQAGDAVSCKLRSALIDCRVNGVPVASTTSTTGAESTRAGLSSYASDTVRFDDFSAAAPSLPDLSIRMTGPALIDFATIGVWQATVSNVGGITMDSGEVLITPPASVTNVTVTGASCFVQGASRRCAIGPLAVGQAVTLEVRATAPPSLVQLTFLSVASSQSEHDPSNNSASFTSVTRSPLPPGARVFDAFDRPNGPVMAADTGQLWTDHANPLTIDSGAAAPSSGFVLSSVDSADGAGLLSATLLNSTSEFWVTLRLSDGANYFRFGRWRDEPYQLQRIQSNYATVFPPITTVSPADGDRVRCLYWLDEIECSVGSVLVARVFDSFNQSASRVGFSAWQSPTTRFDEFLVTAPPPRIDASVGISGPAMLRSATSGSWTVTFRNRGTIATPPVDVLITPSALLSGVTTSGATCVVQASQRRCSIGALPAGVSQAITVSGTAPAALGAVTLSASTGTLVGETQTGDNTATHVIQVRPPIPTGALVVDLFDRPNSQALGFADTGQIWTTHAAGIGIQGNEAALGSGFNLASLNTGVTSGDVSLTLAAPAYEFWIVLRFSDASNYWRFGRWQGGPYQLQQIRDNNIGVPVVQALATVQPASGDQIACRANAFGIDCTVNGVAVSRTTDPFNRTATRIGLSGYQGATARFDDLVVVHVPTGPDLSVSVHAPTLALVGQLQTVRVGVRNNGDMTATPTMLETTLPQTAQAIQVPVGCTVSVPKRVDCALAAALSPGGAQEFAIGFEVASSSVVSGAAHASVVGDAFAGDNQASWTTNTETVTAGIFDNFNRPDTTSGLGSTLTGQTWQARSGGFRIVSNQARATVPGSLATVDGGFAFGTLEVVLGDSPQFGGLVFRVVDQNNYYRLTSDSGFYRLAKVVDGAVRDLQFYILRSPTPVQSGDLVRIVSRPDDSIFVAVNGRHVIDAGDIQFMHATGWGLLSTSGTPSFSAFSLRTVIEGLATQDDFDGTTGSAVRTPTLGVKYDWRAWIGTAFVYDNGRARPEYEFYSMMALDTSSERATTRVTITNPGRGAWVIFRYVEDGPYFRFGHDDGAPYAVTYLSGVNSQPLPVAVEQLATVSPVAGDIVEVRQFADGTAECRVNGVLTHRFLHTGAGFRSTLTGLAGSGSATRFDDFRVTPLGR